MPILRCLLWTGRKCQLSSYAEPRLPSRNRSYDLQMYPLSLAHGLTLDSPASEFYVSMFRNTLFHLHRLCKQEDIARVLIQVKAWPTRSLAVSAVHICLTVGPSLSAACSSTRTRRVPVCPSFRLAQATCEPNLYLYKYRISLVPVIAIVHKTY
jgi:hypothetical protein